VKLYTKTGDKGKTSVIGARVDKDDTRVEAYGTVDELNSFIGQAISVIAAEAHPLKPILQHIQHTLFDLGVDLATVTPQAHKIQDVHVAHLERQIDTFAEQTPAITYFILPGGTPLAAALHVSRAVCRRAERAIVRLDKEHPVQPEGLQYINRLSDFLFAAARWINHNEQVPDIRYESNPSPSS